MSRDPRRLEVFQLADALVARVCHVTRIVPTDERYGIQKQVRRAAISVACNIVEGCARRTEREYLHFINIALGSAAETQYLLRLAARLGLLANQDGDCLCQALRRPTQEVAKLATSHRTDVAVTGNIRAQSPPPKAWSLERSLSPP